MTSKPIGNQIVPKIRTHITEIISGINQFHEIPILSYENITIQDTDEPRLLRTLRESIMSSYRGKDASACIDEYNRVYCQHKKTSTNKIMILAYISVAVAVNNECVNANIPGSAQVVFAINEIYKGSSEVLLLRATRTLHRCISEGKYEESMNLYLWLGHRHRRLKYFTVAEEWASALKNIPIFHEHMLALLISILYEIRNTKWSRLSLRILTYLVTTPTLENLPFRNSHEFNKLSLYVVEESKIHGWTKLRISLTVRLWDFSSVDALFRAIVKNQKICSEIWSSIAIFKHEHSEDTLLTGLNNLSDTGRSGLIIMLQQQYMSKLLRPNESLRIRELIGDRELSYLSKKPKWNLNMLVNEILSPGIPILPTSGRDANLNMARKASCVSSISRLCKAVGISVVLEKSMTRIMDRILRCSATDHEIRYLTSQIFSIMEAGSRNLSLVPDAIIILSTTYPFIGESWYPVSQLVAILGPIIEGLSITDDLDSDIYTTATSQLCGKVNSLAALMLLQVANTKWVLDSYTIDLLRKIVIGGLDHELFYSNVMAIGKCKPSILALYLVYSTGKSAVASISITYPVGGFVELYLYLLWFSANLLNKEAFMNSVRMFSLLLKSSEWGNRAIYCLFTVATELVERAYRYKNIEESATRPLVSEMAQLSLAYFMKVFTKVSYKRNMEFETSRISHVFDSLFERVTDKSMNNRNLSSTKWCMVSSPMSQAINKEAKRTRGVQRSKHRQKKQKQN